MLLLLASCGCRATDAADLSRKVPQPKTLMTYAAPAGAPISAARYVVQVRQKKAAWRNVDLYNFFSQRVYNSSLTSEPNVGVFDCDGAVEVRVESKTPIQNVAIRPLSRAIRPLVRGNVVTFTIDDKSRQIALEINGDALHALLLFTNAVEKNPPRAGAADVTYFGRGYHKAGSIALSGKANQTIYLAGGAVVEGSIDVSQCKNLKITGSGILFTPQSSKQVPLKIDGCSGVVSRLTVLSRAENWTVWCHASRDIVFSNAKIIGEIRDALDIINSQKIEVSHCYLQSQDDVICLKGLQYARAQNVEDVQIEYSILNNMGGGNGLDIGHELDAPFVRNIVFRNLDIIHNLQNADAGFSPAYPTASIGIHPTSDVSGHSALIDNILFDDIRIEDSRDQFLIDIWTNKPTGPAKNPIKNITFRNVRLVDGTLLPSRIEGNAQAPISNVKFEGLLNREQLIRNQRDAKMEIGANVTGVTFGLVPRSGKTTIAKLIATK